MKNTALLSLVLPMLSTIQTSSAASLLTTAFTTSSPIVVISSGDQGVGLGSSDFYTVESNGVTTFAIDQWHRNQDSNRMDYALGTYTGGTEARSNRRGTLQIMKDSKATFGMVDISLVVTIAAGDSVFVELYGWNTGDATAMLSWGGPAGGARWNDTNVNGADTLVDLTYTTSGTKAVATGLDLGTGYDYYSWRVGMSAANGAEATTFSNLTVTLVPEPSSATLIGLAGLGLLLRRRK